MIVFIGLLAAIVMLSIVFRRKQANERSRRAHSGNGQAGGAMRRSTKALAGLAAAVLLVAAGFAGYHIHSMAKYDIYRDHRGLFEAVKDETERLMSNRADLGDTGITILYDDGGNAAADRFYDGMSASLQEQIKQLVLLSEDRLSFLKYSRHNGKGLVSFVFDWEMAYGDSYHIVYCESRDEVVKTYDADSIDYVLNELDKGWFGIGLK